MLFLNCDICQHPNGKINILYFNELTRQDGDVPQFFHADAGSQPSCRGTGHPLSSVQAWRAGSSALAHNNKSFNGNNFFTFKKKLTFVAIKLW